MKLSNLVPSLEDLAQSVEDTDIQPSQAEEQEQTNVDQNNVTGDDQAAELTEQVAETEAASQDIEGIGKDINTADNAVRHLEQIQDAAEDIAATRGGLTPSSAQIIQSTLESIHRSLGISQPAIPTIESFSGTWSKKEATRMTLESLGDSAKGAWEKLIQHLKNLMESVYNFLIRVFQNRALLEKRILNLKIKLRSMGTDVVKKSDELKGSFVRGLVFDGRMNVDTAYAALSTSRTLVSAYDIGVDAIDRIRDGRLPADDSHVVMIKDYLENTLSHVRVSYKSGSETEDIYGALPNGMSIGFRKGSSQDAIFYHTNTPMNGGEAPTTAVAMEHRDIYHLLDQSLDVVKRLRSIENRTAGIMDAVKGIMRKLSNEYIRLRAALGSADHDNVLQARSQARAVQLILSKIIGRFPSSIFVSIKNIADYCDAAIRNFKPA